VPAATLFCTKEADGERVTVVANREMYALNGTATSAELRPPFDLIWRDDPKAPGLKIDIGPMIERGLALLRGLMPPERSPRSDGASRWPRPT